MVFLKDHTTGPFFLADTGASVSMVSGPLSSSSGGQLITAANGAAIATGPERRITLCLKDNQSVQHQFSFDFIQVQVNVADAPGWNGHLQNGGA